jgi:Predicted transcriptional regulator
MFKSNIRMLMEKKKKTVRSLADETGVSSQTVFRATQDDTIGSCQLNTLSKIGAALGVKTKRLYEEMPDAGQETRASE